MHKLRIEVLGKQNTAFATKNANLRLSNKGMFSFIQRIFSYTLWIINHTAVVLHPTFYILPMYIHVSLRACFALVPFVFWCKCLHFHNVSLYWQHLGCFFLEVAYRLFELLLISVWIKKKSLHVLFKCKCNFDYMYYSSVHAVSEKHCSITFYKNCITFHPLKSISLMNSGNPGKEPIMSLPTFHDAIKFHG